MRGYFLWRLGCLFILLPILVVGSVAGIFWLADSVPGLPWHPSGPFGWASPFRLLVPLIGFGGVFLVLRALRGTAGPFADLLAAAERISNGDYSARVPETGPRGIRALAHAFNSMSSRLQVHDEQRRSLLADTTHALRTPLTVIQGNLEAMLDGIYPADEAHLSTTLEETHRLARRIDDLRTLALAESGALRLHKEPTDVATLVNETLASFRSQADMAGVELRAEVDPDVLAAEIDPARIREVIENLIANALRYTPRGGQVRVRAQTDDRASSIILTIEDTGEGIAPQDLANIFERFSKGADSRGMGLGLAIAKDLVVAHGGEITADSELGKGTTVRITLPADAPV